MFRKILVLNLVALCLSATAAFAQDAGLEGHVWLGELGTPAVGATVTVMRGNDPDNFFETTTNDSGYYSFEALPPGPSMVQAHLEGFGEDMEFAMLMPDHVETLDFILGGSLDEEGSVAGSVLLESGEVAAGAMVMLDGGSGWHFHHFDTETDDAGNFSFDAVPEGTYNISAMLMGEGFASAIIEVVPDQTTNVTLTLEHGNGGGDHGHDTLETVTRTGTAIVDTMGDDNGMHWVSYQLDEDGDGQPDYDLDFGPPFYDPDGPGGAERPNNGDEITVVGGLRDRNWGLPEIVVYEINGLFWSEPDHGGGGEPGDTLETVTRTGTALVDTIDMNGMMIILCQLDEDGDGQPDYDLNFGPPDYDPDGPGGAERPNDGDQITVVGGLHERMFMLPEIIVYEINGLFWHEPHHGGDHGGGDHGHHGDSLTVVELAGTAMVVEPDPGHPFTHYLIDTDNDGTADYRLCFGPPWYDPDGEGVGAERPLNGDDITITGGLFSYGDPPMVIVYDINGMFWREPRDGHGGVAGGDHEAQGCEPGNVVRLELSDASAMVFSGEGFHSEGTLYGADADENQMPDYYLDFGALSYDPQNGAERATNGQSLTFVGGVISCTEMGVPIVLVYEINGEFWREPGDTSGMGHALSAEEPVGVGTPLSYAFATNYPNPFNPTTTITYSVPATGGVTLTVFDIMGREVETLVNRFQNAGTYAVNWNAAGMPSGIYFYRLNAAGQFFTNRMILLK